MTAKFIWLDGELVGWDEATVHVGSLGLHYGIGFFEGIRCHSTSAGPAIFRLTDHLRRLRRSAAVYGVDLPFPVKEMAEACRLVVNANDLPDCYIRPIVFLGAGSDPFSASFRAAVIASESAPVAGSPDGSGVRACISSFRRMSANSLPPAAKACGQYLNSYLAQREALNAGYELAIFLNEHGYVADGWAHNVFAVLGGSIVTPPTSAGSLPGITRQTVMTLASESRMTVCEQPLVRSDLYLAEECFVTGTSAGLLPIVSVDGREIGDGRPGRATRRLSENLTEVMRGSLDDHPEWREVVR